MPAAPAADDVSVGRYEDGILASARASLVAALLAVVAACTAAALLGPASASAAPSAAWAKSSLRYTAQSGLLPRGATRRPYNKMTRAGFVQALARLDRQRANATGTPPQLDTVNGWRAYPDAPKGSLYAKAIELKWVRRRKGGFGRRGKVTADDAAWGIVNALGLGPSSRTFAAQLRREVPGARTNYQLKAAHVYTRALGLRYNHLSGTERLEVGPNEAMRIAHLAYMLHNAAAADEWRMWSVREYENFQIPKLTAAQRKVLATGVRLIGQPYVWAGETEGWQPEGHGGFDCSGFTVRVLRNNGLSRRQVQPFGERTSMAMSARGRRIRNVARLRAGDMAFFGYRGRKSSPSENFHVGVMMGNSWMIHSSGGNAGVTIQQVDGWWAENFSWGRRVMRR